MGRVKCKLKWVEKYLKRTGRMKTLLELNKDLEGRLKKDKRNSSQSKPRIQEEGRKFKEDRPKKKKEEKKKELDKSKENQKEGCKPVKLSFAIQKAPERKKIELEPPKPKKKDRSKDIEEPKTVEFPKEFKKIARKFGLPEDHLPFFYEHREFFNWEMKKEFVVHCVEPGCNLTVKEGEGCLNKHMISVHHYKDIVCGKTDCSYIAYSGKNLNLHHSHFHGHGKKQVKDARFSCPYPSCKISFSNSFNLRHHVNTHKNIVYSCDYCPFRCVQYVNLSLHLKVHFNIKDFVCEVCASSFPTISGLNRHKNYKHSNDDFHCEDCTFSSVRFWEYEKHRKSCTERLKHSRIF